MLVNNYKNILSTYNYGFASQMDSAVQSPFNIIAVDGTENNGWVDWRYNIDIPGNVCGLSYDASYPFVIDLGTGKSETTPDMTALENSVNAPEIVKSSDISYSDGVVYNAIIRNHTENQWNVSEIGLYIRMTLYTSATTSKRNIDVMIAREVLETPITVEAGEAVAVSVKLQWR